jgi:hypothetical protein
LVALLSALRAGQTEAGAKLGIFSDQERKAQDGQERTVSVRQRQEI